MRYYIYLLSLFLMVGCLKKDEAVTPDVDETIEVAEESEEKKSTFLETAEPFYPLKETVEDIQTQLDDLRARVIEYETRVSTPSFNTDVLKMIKVPQLKHEINLTNGTLIQGTILQENMDKLIVQTQIGQLTIDKGNVETIQEIAPSNAKIEFSGDAQEKIYDSGKTFSGTVINNGLQRADFVRVIYNLWGSETDLIASDSSFVEGTAVVYHSGIITDTAMRPGETAEFFVNVKFPKDASVQYITRDIRWDSYE